ncbi:MAG TPA: argininosuccinate lyase [Longimicrobiales bacterium]|nr:argininosuccinate lyase [Longimicrobiales bacterium]
MSQGPTETAGALWGGRFREGLAPEMTALNLSLDVDFRLWRHDVRGSIAWAGALGRAGLLSDEEVLEIQDGLERVALRLELGPPPDAADEDIHSLVERLLIAEVGEVGGKLHSGRSRNDQVATDVRLWGMEVVQGLEGRIDAVVEALLARAEEGLDLIMPGYTHLQQGQPIRAAHWALAHAWPLLRDRERLRRVRHDAGVLPLGSGAVAGCPFPVDRDALARELGFHAVTPNSLDAVSDRDWMADLVHAGALLGVHLSRLAEDLVLFTSREFGFVRLADGYSTGSSLMPQKRNPDVAELVRGKSGRLVGNAAGFLTLLKGLPTGYNRDLQEDKTPLFDTVDTLEMVLPALAGALATARFRPERIHGALDSQLLATDLADYLVRRGVPFRRSHEAIGHLVREAEEEGCSLEDLSDDVFRAAHPAFEADVRDVFDWTASVESRAVPGGTARAAVEAQMVAMRERLEG